GVWTLFGLSASLLFLSLLPVGALYLGIAFVAAKWGPARQPRFTLPPGTPEDTRWGRFIIRVYNLFPPVRAASVTLWLVILLAGVGVGAVELHERFAAGNWPYPFSPEPFQIDPDRDLESTVCLALAAFYVPLSLLRLLRLAREDARRSDQD